MGFLVLRMFRSCHSKLCVLSSRIVECGPKKQRPYLRECSRVALKKRRPCPGNESSVAPNILVSVLEKIRGWHSRNYVPVLHKRQGWHSRNGVPVFQEIRWWYRRICVPVLEKGLGWHPSTAYLSSRYLESDTQATASLSSKWSSVTPIKQRPSLREYSRLHSRKDVHVQQKSQGWHQRNRVPALENCRELHPKTASLSLRKVLGGTQENESLSSRIFERGI
jgi:hypothetical protein